MRVAASNSAEGVGNQMKVIVAGGRRGGAVGDLETAILMYTGSRCLTRGFSKRAYLLLALVLKPPFVFQASHTS